MGHLSIHVAVKDDGGINNQERVEVSRRGDCQNLLPLKLSLSETSSLER